MRPWRARRASAFAPGFDDYLTALDLGIDVHWLWDQAIVEIEHVLCGASREHLDVVYPPNSDGLRLMLTQRIRGLPPLRIAFRLDDEDDERVVYVAVSRRA